jgi:hypothetical protein
MRYPSTAFPPERTPRRIRQSLRTILARASNANAPYSPVLSFSLLAILALAATIGH